MVSVNDLADRPATSTDSPMEATIEAEQQSGYSSGAPHTSTTLEGLASLQPTTLALMHGSTHSGAADKWLYELADYHRTAVPA